MPFSAYNAKRDAYIELLKPLFLPDDPDAVGNVVYATVKHIARDLALIQYTQLPKLEKGPAEQTKPSANETPALAAAIEEAPAVVRYGGLSKMPATSSGDLFSQRFALAFPGVRSAAWFESEEDIANRLEATKKFTVAFFMSSMQLIMSTQ